MAQGKEWTIEEKETIIQSLKPYLEMGYSRNKACSFIGLTPSTLSNWVKDDESLGMKLTGWENVVNTIAIANIKKAIELEGKDEKDIRKENSWKWIERKEESFKPKQDVTTNDKDLPTPIMKLDGILPNNSNNQNSETE